MKKACIFLPILFLVWANVSFGFVTTAKTALVVDNTTGDVLLSKDIHRPIPPASMSKLMTLWMVFEALEKDRLSLQEKLIVSRRAWKKGGSKMFLRQGEKVTIENLIRGVIIQSGNDACIVLAEGLGGTEENFAELMTIRAKEIGLEHSNFSNSTGWPDPKQKMSSSDLLLLAEKIRTQFPEYYKIFKEIEFTWDGITQKNRNPLLAMKLGVDGLKTGYTEEAGYGLIASAKQGKRRISFIITGLKSTGQRAREAKGITTWAFRHFKLHSLFEKNENIVNAPIWLGTKKTIELASPVETRFLTPRNPNDLISAKIILDGEIVAPIKKGQPIKGRLVIETKPLKSENTSTRKLFFPLIANETVKKGGFTIRVRTNFLSIKKHIFDLFRVKE